jgi:hypothetical protein
MIPSLTEMQEVHHPDEPMPPVTGIIPKGTCSPVLIHIQGTQIFPEDGDDSEDDDMEIGGVTQDYKCPLTLTTFVDPMTA